MSQTILNVDDSQSCSHLKSPRYRSFVGPHEKYDLIAASQFCLLVSLGLREHHHLLDIGCGSLRGGKLFIPYLLPGRYWGIEPESWLIHDGIEHELGQDIVRIKAPSFSDDCDFRLTRFGRSFDFLLAQSIFSHASSSQIRRCMAEARQVMKHGSIFAATFVQGSANYAGTDWVYPGAVTYTPEYLIDLISDEGLAARQIDWQHPNGQRWLVIEKPVDCADTRIYAE